MSINHVTLSGNLTREQEIRQTQSGSSVLRFSIAVNDRMKNPDGSWGDRANYFDCVAFGKQAEAWNKWLAKGVHVVIDGMLRYQSWEKDGQKRSKVEIMVDSLETQRQTQPKQDTGYYSEDLPF